MTDVESTKYLRDLRRGLTRYFNLTELQALAHDVSVDWDELAGSNKSSKAQSLIRYLARRGRLSDLLTLLHEERPHVDWVDPPSPEQQIVDEGTLITDSERESVLQNYLDKINDIMGGLSFPWSKRSHDPIFTAKVQAYTEAATPYLDKRRLALVLRFLGDMGLPNLIKLRGRDLTEIDLSGAELSGANLSDTTLIRANLSKAKLNKTLLRNANLSEALVNEAELVNADLSGATLIRANLTESDLSRAELFRADMSGANLYIALVKSARLNDARLTKANLVGCELQEASLTRADLSESLAMKAFLIEADLRWANLRHANLGGADLRNADLREADLRGTNLDKPDLESFDLFGVEASVINLGNKSLYLVYHGTEEANLKKAKLTNALIDNHTRWPSGFEWENAGIKLVE